MHLSHFAITKAKPREKPYKVADGAGLYLLVEPNGSKLWRFRYRFAGRENMLTFGPYPAVSLGDTREKRDQARKLLASGADPSAKRKQDKREAGIANAFGAIADEVLSNKEANQAAGSTMDKNHWLLKDLAAPLADRPVAEVTAAEILQLLKHIEKSGRRETARRLAIETISVARRPSACLGAPRSNRVEKSFNASCRWPTSSSIRVTSIIPALNDGRSVNQFET